jgi:hypothetical protein
VSRQLNLDDVLLCKDRSIGHDWPHVLNWEPGPDAKQGRRTVWVHYRVCRCLRCGTIRKEIFIQTSSEFYKQKPNGNRYHYSDAYKHAGSFTQPEIHRRLFNQRRAGRLKTVQS